MDDPARVLGADQKTGPNSTAAISRKSQLGIDLPDGKVDPADPFYPSEVSYAPTEAELSPAGGLSVTKEGTVTNTTGTTYPVKGAPVRRCHFCFGPGEFSYGDYFLCDNCAWFLSEEGGV